MTIPQEQSTPKRVAVVGSGLAGLTAAHFLQESGFTVHLFEKASTVGMDAGSLTVEGVRVDVPFRVFNPDYYPYLYRMYKHLGIGFAAADYSLAFTRDKAKTVWSYTNISLGDFQVPIPDQMALVDRMAITRDWVRLVFLCLKVMTMPHLLRPGGRLDQTPIGVYLSEEGYTREFCDLVFVPFLASLFTCSLSAAAAYPANTVLHFVSKAVYGARLRKAKNGVQEVCDILTKSLACVHLNASVRQIVLPKEGADEREIVLVTQDGQEHRFDVIVMATPADITASLLQRQQQGPKAAYPPSDLLSALQSVPYESALVVTHRDDSVMPSNCDDWRGVNIGTVAGKQHAMASHWINHVERTTTGRKLTSGVFQTVNPLVPLDEKKVLSSTLFHRSLLTVDSQAQINTVHKYQGESNVWFVGTYTSPGVPLLEGCVRTAVDVVHAMGGKLPFDPPKMTRRTANGGGEEGFEYEVGLGPGMARGEVVEAYFECDAAGTFVLARPPLTPPSGSGSSSVAAWSGWLQAWGAWLGFAVFLPLLILVLSLSDRILLAALGNDLGNSVQMAALDAVLYAMCGVRFLYKQLALSQ
ncbi:FAD/NAD(P)-binding domain-containing protein [Martensiomyces pterosporus]|nr:FAD/NAD(P)-binding domain-containing protein [Martensiomyces pterosporus]